MSPIKTSVANRLLSLDVFRGITIATMILVNNPGNEYAYTQLEHSEWNGCTVTDLVFPFFLFIIGVSIFYSMDGKRNQIPHSKLITGALRRSLILFGLSLFLFLIPKILTDPIEAFRTVRIEGILERIAIVYFVCSVIFIKTSTKTQINLFFIFLILYWAIMTFIPVPGIGPANYGMDTNLGAWLDRLVIGEAHLINKTWDNQAILGNISAFSTCILGILVGTLLKKKGMEAADKVAWMFTIGVAGIISGLIWDTTFPINKLLWSSSYVLYTGGLACVGLALCYWLIDVKGYSRGLTPFVAFGRNAIAIYFLSEFIPRLMNLIRIPNGEKTISLRSAVKNMIEPLFTSPYNSSLAHGIFYVLVFLGVAYWMYKKNVIIKI